MTPADIRRLVTRIENILGPDATPERVEAIAAAVLDELGTPAAEEACGCSAEARPAAPQYLSGERVVVTAYGCDAPGVLADITRVISESGCNVQDVSQKILQGYFTLIMLADISSMRRSVRELQEDLNRVGERLGVRVLVQHEDLFNAMHRP